jgi:cation diffusion facilitator family transporter
MADTADRPIVVYIAIAANAAIAITKFIASVLSGSSAMLSEGVHSVVDTGDQLLLLHGVRRSRKPADQQHPFGYGQELYFWGFVVAMLLFSLGGGVSMYEGVMHLLHPHELRHVIWNYAVLSVAFVFEGVSWSVAFRELLSGKRKHESLWRAMRGSKDTSVYTVLGEDSAALLGAIVAFLGIFLSHRWDSPVPDGIASILIGLILIVVAVFLAVETKGLLLGERADSGVLKDIVKIACEDPCVTRVNVPLTMHLSPQEILLNLEVAFRPDMTTAQIAAAINRMEARIRGRHAEITRIFIEVRKLAGASADQCAERRE